MPHRVGRALKSLKARGYPWQSLRFSMIPARVTIVEVPDRGYRSLRFAADFAYLQCPFG